MQQTIADIMSTNLLYLPANTRVALARQKIIDLWVTAVPILDETRRPVGIVSLRDLVGANGDQFEPSTNVATLKSTDSVMDGAKTLATSSYHHMVVVDAVGVAAGMVSAIDFIRALTGLPARHPTALERC